MIPQKRSWNISDSLLAIIPRIFLDISLSGVYPVIRYGQPDAAVPFLEQVREINIRAIADVRNDVIHDPASDLSGIGHDHISAINSACFRCALTCLMASCNLPRYTLCATRFLCRALQYRWVRTRGRNHLLHPLSLHSLSFGLDFMSEEQ